MNNDPVNFVDLWGLTASDRKLTRKEKKELIKKSINNISESEWAQTEEGKIVVNKLKKMESKGKIKIKEAGEGCNGWYDNGNKYLQSTYNESDERSDEWIRNAYRDDFDK